LHSSWRWVEYFQLMVHRYSFDRRRGPQLSYHCCSFIHLETRMNNNSMSRWRLKATPL
jgi:hypothetical protein